ncbi:MAG: hypothetical protein QNJ46_08090 [Leptolyngbyaceae cyanobacterium MO_188.B28]|nr:hypothetical protein [Leptolyngbyaceae cyanobacterium MO_188.B28]
MISPTNLTAANSRLEVLVRSAIASGELLPGAEAEIDRVLDNTSLTDRELRLMMILQDEIANGDVKRITVSSQRLQPSQIQPQKTKVSLLCE